MELTPQQWENVKALFECALEKTPAGRISFLDAATDDVQVRREVARLLTHHTESGGLLSTRAVAGVFAKADDRKPALAPGFLIAERFRITRFIARGGMGEVYEAEDLELHERVALKSIRTELLHDARAVQRLKREVHLARKVTHPNVCRIFDLVRQSTSEMKGTDQAPAAFVVMELLQGETLAEFLEHHARLSVGEALPIALQVASGLGAAHAAGILHRDFKPGNVLLVSSEKGMRAVITDFGLALRSTQDASIGPAITGGGELLGTPAYMSPEQVENKELTPASDVYSLGLVLYQMITGMRAFEDTTPLSMAVRRVKEKPPSPRTFVPDLDRRWEAIILQCLARDPRNRFQSGDEVVTALRDDAKPQPRAVDRRIVAGAVLAAIIVTAGLILTVRSRRVSETNNTATTATPIAARPSIAVLPFHNLSGHSDTEWVSTALAEMLTEELAAGGKLRTFPGENVARATTDLGLTGKQTLARDTLTHLRQYLGSDYVVLGSYLNQGSSSESQIRVDLWLQDAKTGETTAAISEKGSSNDLDGLATQAGADLRQKLGAGEVTPGEAALVRASLPSNPGAVRLYSEGLVRLRLGDAPIARDLLQRSVAADPNYALGHSALADAWAAMGYDEKAREESRRALDLSSGLSHEEHLWIEGKNWELNRKWDKAVEIYRTLFDFFPDNIEYGLHLAAAETHARTLDEALSKLATLRRLPAPNGNDPRIDLEQADIFDIKGAYRDQQASAEAAASRARELGAKLLLARALNQQARSFEKQGKLDDAIHSAQQAASISGSAGEGAEAAKAQTIIGIVRFDQGNFHEAAKAYNHALAVLREIGDKRATATTLNDLANALGEEGDLLGSINMLHEALATFREVGDKHSAAAVLGSIAARTLQQGNLRQSKEMLEQCLAASRELGDQERGSTALYNLGEVLRWQGDLQGAREKYQESEDLSKQIGDQSGVAYALFSLGDVAMAQADFIDADAKYQQSMSLRTQIGEQGNVAETQMALGVLALERGRQAEAESLVRQANEEFHKEGLGDDEVLADVLLARIRLSEGTLSDAKNESSAASQLSNKSQDFSVRLRTAILIAQVQAASGKFPESTSALEDAIRNASRSGYFNLQLEAQLALAEVKIHAHQNASALALLAGVRKRAQERGFKLIANKAIQLSAESSRN
jgi:eukaryotic-like serine/threonine-protein kinase